MAESTPEPDAEQARLEAQRERRRANREKYKAADADRVRQQNRDSMRRSRERARALKARQERDRARVKAGTAANPERAAARRDAWAEQHPDRVREHQRNYYHRNREVRQAASRDQSARRREDPAVREMARQYQAARLEHRNAQQNARRSDPSVREKLNREQNERRRRERRRQALGLAPRPMHRATINERARNAAEAAAFAARKWSKQDLQRLQEELREVRAETARSPHGRWAAELEAQIRADAAKPARLDAAIDRHLRGRAGPVLREEVRMDSIARELRGVGPYPNVEAEVRRRAAAVLEARQALLAGPERASRPARPVLGFEAPSAVASTREVTGR